VIVQITDHGLRLRDEPRQSFDQSAERRISAAIYIHDLSFGGVERQSLAMAKELREHGIDVTLVVHQLRGELMPFLPEGVPVVNLNSARTLQDIAGLRNYLRTEHPDVFMANVDHNNIAAALANMLTRTPTKLVICQHNPLTAGYHATVNWKHRVVPWFYRALEPSIDHAVAVSNGIADELINLGLPPSKVSTIFNAVIGEDFEARANMPVDHRWLVNKDRPVFVTAGRLVEMKDHRTLLRAFAIHLERRPSRLIVMGAGPMLAELQTLANTLGITEHVAFEGFVANPLPFMSAADAFVLSSRAEGFGNVLVEALGCGTPVISTDCPHGPSDILANGQFGILVPPQDPKAMADAFSRLLDDRQHWSRERLRDRANTFTYSACVEQYAKLFRTLTVH
jgi:glycosyltransferase involved in cell wall biosynthesis